MGRPSTHRTRSTERERLSKREDSDAIHGLFAPMKQGMRPRGLYRLVSACPMSFVAASRRNLSTFSNCSEKNSSIRRFPMCQNRLAGRDRTCLLGFVAKRDYDIEFGVRELFPRLASQIMNRIAKFLLQHLQGDRVGCWFRIGTGAVDFKLSTRQSAADRFSEDASGGVSRADK